MRSGLAAALIFSVLALAAAYVMQYGLGLLPCRLCYWQRYPYMAIIAIAILAFVTRRVALGCLLAAILFAVDAAIAVYHASVEAGIIALPEGCAAGAAASMEAMMQSLSQAPPRCDQPAFVFLGGSLSTWNALAAAGMMVVTLSFWWRNRR